jgi:type IV pilus assembly protein PilC
MREALESIKFDVERGGEKLWAAMGHRPNEFSDLEIAMVAAGEEAGNREDVFERLATFLEREERTRKQLASALFYPFLVLVAAGIVSIYLVTFVVPQFAKLFDSFGVARSPLLTMLVDLTTLATNPVVDIGLLASLATSLYVWSRAMATPEGALAFDAIRLRAPFAGQVIRKTIVARTCRVVATLLEAGVNQVRALEVSAPVAESPVYARALDAARERIVDGRSASLEEALRESDLFPPLVLGFIRIGASAGNVPSMLTKVAQYYEDDVEALLSAVPAVVQTSVTLGLGAVVGLIVYVVYIPLSTLSSSIH